MYKFTNGIVVYDKETRDKYINAGMILIEENKDGENSAKHISEEVKPNESERLGGFEEGTGRTSVANGRRVETNKPKTRK